MSALAWVILAIVASVPASIAIGLFIAAGRGLDGDNQ